ncbi:MAG: sulfotransferase [Microscillaceae bacterium]
MKEKQRVSVRQYRPAPWPVRLFNWVGKQKARLWASVPLREKALLEAAQRQTGLHDFGEEYFREPLNRLLEAIHREARLHAFGQMITRIRLVNLLCNRLRAQYFYKKHPEILEQELAPLLVITGLQRTGTTLLQRLLACDPQNRALYSWEALNPAPFLKVSPRSEDPRLKAARRSEQGLRYLSPDFFAIHPVEHNAPEEEILLIDQSFLSTVPEATMHVPSFAAWVEKQDQSPAYQTLAQLLKLLQWQRGGKRWVLKTPHHLEFLDVLTKLFPSAKIIHTHRDPSVSVASFCSMVFHGRRIFSNQVDAREVGQHWSRKTAYMVQKALDYRATTPAQNFLDIQYQDLTQDTWGQMGRIYQWLGVEWKSDSKARMQTYHQQAPAHKYGLHQYALEDFGLNKSDIDQTFGHYIKTYLPK